MNQRPDGFLFLLGPLFAATVAYADPLPADNRFYSPTISSATTVLNPSAGNGDDTLAFNNAIAGLGPAGGTVTVNPGVYRLLGVQLQSNVHLRIDAGVTILPFDATAGTSTPIFDADLDEGLENFSIIGTGGRFTIDYSSVVPGGKMRAVHFKNASNFKAANFNVIDNYTKFSALTFGPNTITESTPDGKRIASVRGVPNQGIIEDVDVTGLSAGYGLAQLQSAKSMLFRNIASEGGVALRLESGGNTLQYATGENLEAIRVDDIWGRDISTTNGSSTLVLQPHAIHQGKFDVRGITAVSNSSGVKWAPGFANQEQAEDGLTAGSYSSESVIRDVDVTFGHNAQMHVSKELRYIPCPLRYRRENGEGIAVDQPPDNVGRVGPSYASVFAKFDHEDHYDLDFPASEVTAHGFRETEHYLPPNAFITDSHDDFEECEQTVEELNFWVPKDFRDTPNRWKPRELSGDSDDDRDVDGADFLAWQRGHGESGYWFEGDFDGTGTVNSLDLQSWQANFRAQASGLGAVTVPEPSGLVLCLLGFLGYCRYSLHLTRFKGKSA